MTSCAPHRARVSFRDPSGHVVVSGDRVLRFVKDRGKDHLLAFLASPAATRMVNARILIQTSIVAGALAEELLNAHSQHRFASRDVSLVVEHEKVTFQSFPYEWPPEMLHAAARLTLRIAEEVLPEGFWLKDATPYNILFRGPHPIFVDVLSFERRNPLDPVWLANAQFIRTFLLPLVLNKIHGIDIHRSLSLHRDGIEPEEVYRHCGTVRRFLPPVLTLVSVPTWLNRLVDVSNPRLYEPKLVGDPDKARFIARSVLRRASRILAGLSPAEHKSRWTEYTTFCPHEPDYVRAKDDFVATVLRDFSPARLLDIGCNTGRYSVMAAQGGSAVVAIDQDPSVVGILWRTAERNGLNILPLVVNIAQPSPSLGWRNSEYRSFLDRARGEFDAVFMLAFLHHLLLGEGIQLSEVVDLAAELTTDLFLIEFIPPEDRMLQIVARGREFLCRGMTMNLFESEFNARFEMIRRQKIGDSGRIIYLFRKRRGET